MVSSLLAREGSGGFGTISPQIAHDGHRRQRIELVPACMVHDGEDQGHHCDCNCEDHDRDACVQESHSIQPSFSIDCTNPFCSVVFDRLGFLVVSVELLRSRFMMRASPQAARNAT